MVQVHVGATPWRFESSQPHPGSSAVYEPDRVGEVLRLARRGLNKSQIAERTGVSRATIRSWLNGHLPRPYRLRIESKACEACGEEKHGFDRLGPEYLHLLGLYLGDGSIARHRRDVYRLRIDLDVRYPGIVDECEEAMRAVVSRNRVSCQLRPCNCFEVYAYSKSWPCLFPQHGPGKKHTRRIVLSDWQQHLAERWPERLLKGLIQSDGCRSYSTGSGNWRQPRYAFANVSTDVTSIFCSACDCLGLQWTASFPKSESAAVSIYVSRKADVAKLDELVGPKR